MATLRKMKKVELIELVEIYEEELELLRNQQVFERVVYLRDEVNNKTTDNLKKRLEIISDEHRRAIYMRELHRINESQRQISVV